MDLPVRTFWKPSLHRSLFACALMEGLIHYLMPACKCSDAIQRLFSAFFSHPKLSACWPPQATSPGVLSPKEKGSWKNQEGAKDTGILSQEKNVGGRKEKQLPQMSAERQNLNKKKNTNPFPPHIKGLLYGLTLIRNQCLPQTLVLPQGNSYRAEDTGYLHPEEQN